MKALFLTVSIISSLLTTELKEITYTVSESNNTDVQLISNVIYEEISWDHLLSEYEREFYYEEYQRYVADPKYMGRPTPPPAVNPDIDGKKIKIPGYAVSVDIEPGVINKTKTFLFVPTAGACVHIPPPPVNQTIFVEMKKSIEIDPYKPLYVEGTIHLEEGDNGIAAYYYRIDGYRVTDYQ